MTKFKVKSKGDKETSERNIKKGEEYKINSKDSSKLLVNEDSAKKWQNWNIRLFWTILMVSGFITILLLGPLSTLLLIVAIQIRVFYEIINLSVIPANELNLPWMRVINSYFLFIGNNFLVWESLLKYFKSNILNNPILNFLATHHRFKSFIFYCIGFVWFVLNLKKGHYRFQFRMFCINHMLLILVVASSHFIIANVLEGMFWFVFPVSLVIVNDCGAYFAGFFFGRTPLIELSPKKTWEGFIGGLFFTIIFGLCAAQILSNVNFLICPVHDLTVTYFRGVQCDLNPVFEYATYTIPPMLSKYLGFDQVVFRPILIHAFIMSIFASIIAPFGGFFASGFKRAYNIKDFADLIPGHGGLTDRFDCQFLMGVFSYFYYSSFVKVNRLEYEVLGDLIINNLSTQEQLAIYNKLQTYLQNKNILTFK